MPVLTTRVAELILNTDLHKTEIVLRMIDPQGNERGYCLSQGTARQLAESLPHRLAEIEAATSTQTKQ